MASLQEMLKRAVQEIGFLKRRQKLAKGVLRAHEAKAFFLEELVQRSERQQDYKAEAQEQKMAAQKAQGEAVTAALELAGARMEIDVTHRTMTILRLQRDSAREDIDLARQSERIALDNCHQMIADADTAQRDLARFHQIATSQRHELTLSQQQLSNVQEQLAASLAAHRATLTEAESLSTQLSLTRNAAEKLEADVATLEAAKRSCEEAATAAAARYEQQARESAAAVRHLDDAHQAAQADREAVKARCSAAEEQAKLTGQRLAAALERAELAEVRLTERSSLEQERAKMAEERSVLNHGLSQDRIAAAEEKAERAAAAAVERIQAAEDKAQHAEQRAATAEGAAEEKVAAALLQVASAQAQAAKDSAAASADIERLDAAVARSAADATAAEKRLAQLQSELSQAQNSFAKQLQQARRQHQHADVAAAHPGAAAAHSAPDSPAGTVQTAMQAVGAMIDGMSPVAERHVHPPGRATVGNSQQEAADVRHDQPEPEDQHLLQQSHPDSGAAVAEATNTVDDDVGRVDVLKGRAKGKAQAKGKDKQKKTAAAHARRPPRQKRKAGSATVEGDAVLEHHVDEKIADGKRKHDASKESGNHPAKRSRKEVRQTSPSASPSRHSQEDPGSPSARDGAADDGNPADEHKGRRALRRRTQAAPYWMGSAASPSKVASGKSHTANSPSAASSRPAARLRRPIASKRQQPERTNDDDNIVRGQAADTQAVVHQHASDSRAGEEPVTASEAGDRDQGTSNIQQDAAINMEDSAALPVGRHVDPTSAEASDAGRLQGGRAAGTNAVEPSAEAAIINEAPGNAVGSAPAAAVTTQPVVEAAAAGKGRGRVGARPQGLTRVDLNSVWGASRPNANASEAQLKENVPKRAGGIPDAVSKPLDTLNPTVLAAAAVRSTAGPIQKGSYQRAWAAQSNKSSENTSKRKLHKTSINSFAGNIPSRNVPPNNMLFGGAFKIPRLLTGS